MLIGIGEDIIPFGFAFTRSEVKATMVTFVKYENMTKAIAYKKFIFHILICLVRT